MSCRRCQGLMVEESWGEVGYVQKCLICGWVKMPGDPKPVCMNGDCPHPPRPDSMFCQSCHEPVKHRGEPPHNRDACGEASRQSALRKRREAR